MRHRNLRDTGRRHLRLLRRYRVAVGLAVGGIAVLAAVLLWVLGPVSWLVAGDTVRALHGKDRADALNAVRQTVLAAVGGVAVLIGSAYTARAYHLSRRGQVTDRFGTAIAKLASDKLTERLGAVYALEHVMAESPQDHTTVVAVLSAFIRESTRNPSLVPDLTDPGIPRRQGPLPTRGTQPPADVQAAMDALARRPDREEARRVDLRHAELVGLSLRSFEFDAPPRLNGVFLTWANLCHADLRGTDLSGALLNGADLRHAWLGDTRLNRTRLDNADLRDAYFAGTNLLGVYLEGADLRDTDLTAGQLAGAVIDETTRLPPALADDPWVVARLADCRSWRDQHDGPAPPPPPTPAVE
ncbi:pentapeptide repeat-containing protein [Streptomyces mauvecolor]|uniref:Pentapeptide repeat-containing protein n=1 Tax=Streptomyces mauvecolor TaxID=58345 RepID=A0ABV9UHF1_9ACTN